ncbi:transporter substrate-binding domain-containing protein [Bifidobacterium stellenboschense]|uniref:Glutamate-binding protein n=1 Tax=Bifidobacterium stellenboschense TaxID=762211 RepID=A0A087DP86_9BIFI|nr:transporter substrate-binding domain-containing protein [Bifidobacterium stellenboschense]KFI97336.1 glutamate-binding protein [Bifidobacterium stellenboschense]
MAAIRNRTDRPRRYHASRRPGARTCVTRGLAAALTALALVATAGCGGAPSTVRQPDGPTIAIGVAADEPGLSRWHDGGYGGFEVEIARYVAKRLGYANKQIVFKQVEPSNRLELLADGTVDMVVAGMPMPAGDGNDDGDGRDSGGKDGGTGENGVVSDSHATYAGPYLTTRQGLLARPDDAGGIGDVAALAGKSVCTVAGSGAKDALLAVAPRAKTRERDTYPQCVTDLMVGTADAIAGDAVTLAGLARDEGGTLTERVTGVRYGSVRYGIAVQAGAVTLAADIAEALGDMRADGSYRAALDALADATGWRPAR